MRHCFISFGEGMTLVPQFGQRRSAEDVVFLAMREKAIPIRGFHSMSAVWDHRSRDAQCMGKSQTQLRHPAFTKCDYSARCNDFATFAGRSAFVWKVTLHQVAFRFPEIPVLTPSKGEVGKHLTGVEKPFLALCALQRSHLFSDISCRASDVARYPTYDTDALTPACPSVFNAFLASLSWRRMTAPKDSPSQTDDPVSVYLNMGITQHLQCFL